ncbi:Crp/Fnr family transcriptional regulator [Caproiciproducens sp. NJN-50]|uniref:Crp/Fnr family transcriptional regulator n=1 Tax=Acutalibacteraceae TaxID=3082771 RepID=UPI000FFE1C85|nr:MULTISPECIES: Crp/Fnr family transcriptional regulator [Acutalibacteraceae]QAT50500.1 Crp/Fnr family transcriptional regulator [Caproiciproducens sp. NJN-50]
MDLAEYLASESDSLRAKLSPIMDSFPGGAPVSPVSLDSGDALIREGDLCERVSLLLCGRVSVIISRPRFSSYTVTDFRPFEFFGEYELLAGRNRYLAEVRAVSPCRFLTFSSQAYLQWVKNDPEFFFGRVRSILGTLLDQTVNERARHFLDASGRVIQVLLRAYDTRREPLEDVRLDLTRAEIAERTGCSVRTVNRVVRGLAQKGFLSVTHGKIRLNAARRQALFKEFDSHL